MVSLTFVVAAAMGFGGAEASDLEGVVLDFTSPKCGPCQQMSGIVSRLERLGYPIRKVECEANRDLVNRFNVQTIPAFILVVNGREKARLGGVVSEQQLIQLCSRVPRAGNPGDSLGEPGSLPGKSAVVLAGDGPSPSAAPVAKPTSPEKSGMHWPFGSKKNAAPARDLEGAISRAKADDRQKIAVPVQGNPLAASVRIRVRDANGDSFGSGTIIDSRVGQTTIVTCGHIFRNWDKQAVIEVDWFDNGREQTMIGRRLYHDLKADVGIVTINADSLPSCRVAPAGTRLLVATPVISVGCSGGEKPTVQHLKITALNRYQGADNIEVGGMPVEGRSGGGLFTKEGRLIGVCSGADGYYKEGYFIGLKTLHDLLDHCHLSRLYRGEISGDDTPALGETVVADASLGEADDAEAAVENDPEPAPARRNRSSAASVAKVSAPRRPLERSATADSAIGDALEQAPDAEVVCIIRPVNQPGAASRVVILNRASRRFVEYLADELDERPEIVETTLKSGDEQLKARKSATTQQAKRPAALDRLAKTAAQAPESEPRGPQAYRRKRP